MGGEGFQLGSEILNETGLLMNQLPPKWVETSQTSSGILAGG